MCVMHSDSKEYDNSNIVVSSNLYLRSGYVFRGAVSPGKQATRVFRSMLDISTLNHQ